MINSVSLVGRLTKDADLRFTPNGKAVASFTLAVTRSFNREETDFINCQVWGKTAEATANYTKKGSLVGLTGRIQIRSYDNNEGKKIFVTEVVADSVQFLDSKNEKEKSADKATTTQTFDKKSDPFNNPRSIDITDDDLPF